MSLNKFTFPDQEKSAEAYTYILEGMIAQMSMEHSKENPWQYSKTQTRNLLKFVADGPVLVEIWSGSHFLKSLKELEEVLKKEEGLSDHEIWESPESRERASRIPQLLLAIQDDWKGIYHYDSATIIPK